jgi:hypothetical protein
MPILTISTITKIHRRLQRRIDDVDVVLAAMSSGQALYHYHHRGRPIWNLTDGREVLPDTARIAIAHLSLAGVGDCLYEGTISQTYRWIGY